MRFRRLCAAALLATGLTAVPTPATAAVSCQDVSFPVRIGLTPLVTSQETMAGSLCAPAGATTLQVLIPGGTYDRSYWNVGFDPNTHSFTKAQNDAGFATLAIDRLGTGKSSKPLSALLTASTQARSTSTGQTSRSPDSKRSLKVLAAVATDASHASTTPMQAP